VKIIHIALIIGVLFCVLLVSALGTGIFPLGNSDTEQKMGISLVKPAFASTGDASFLDQEAGIAAYANLGQPIDINKAIEVFRTVEKRTSLYVVGSVALPDYPVDEDVHAFINTSGWMVIYYVRDEAASKIIDWNGYSPQKMSNKFEIGAETIAYSLGMSSPDLNYYNFQYPYANNMTIITKGSQESQSDFNLTIPSGINAYEKSWSHCVDVDNTVMIISFGKFSATQLRNDVKHKFTLQNAHYEWGYPQSFLSLDDISISSCSPRLHYGGSIRKTSVAVILICRE
jgi:hypothetical protein